MDASSRSLLRELASWRPEGGVISVFLDIDPADRGGGWRIQLEQRLKEVVSAAEPGDRDATRAAVRRVLDRFPANAAHPSGRSHVGFIEVANGGREVWRSYQLRIDGSQITLEPGAMLTRLVCLLERGEPAGVVLASAERARLLEWSFGELADLESWELEIFSNDWRERKAPQRNPQASGTGTSAAGRDQYDQRLDSSRARFLKECGQLVADRSEDRDWNRLVIFGEGAHPGLLRAGLGARSWQIHESPRDLIRADATEVRSQAEAAIAEIKHLRENELLERLEEAIGSDRGAATGPREVLEALDEGRASHVLFDPKGDFDSEGTDAAELMIALAVSTSATITPVEDEALAARLAQRDSAAALLRY